MIRFQTTVCDDEDNVLEITGWAYEFNHEPDLDVVLVNGDNVTNFETVFLAFEEDIWDAANMALEENYQRAEERFQPQEDIDDEV